MTKGRGYILAATMVLMAASGRFACAQPADAPEGPGSERQSVLDRPRPGYDPLGVHVRSFYLFPVMDVQETYDSNVFATAHDAKSDFYTTVRPALDFHSDWNNHSLDFRAGGDIKRYASRTSENNSNFATSLQGRLDVLRGFYLAAGGGYQLLHEDRSSPDATSSTQPVEYHVTSGNISVVHDRGVLGVRLDLNVDSYDYNNAVSGTGAQIIENDRDRIEYSAAPKVSYEIAPGYHAFVKTAFNTRDYNSEIDTAGFRRSSKGYAVDAGTDIEVTHVINGEVYATYVEQKFDDPRLQTASGFGLGSNLLWNITRLTSIRLAAQTNVEETTIAPASSYVQSAFTLSAEHELLRNLLLSEFLSYANQDYQGISRSDDVYGTGFGLKYLLTRNLAARLDVSYSQRNSEAVNADYQRLLTVASVRFQF